MCWHTRCLEEQMELLSMVIFLVGSARVVPGMEEACAVSVDGLDKTKLYSSQLVGRTVS